MEYPFPPNSRAILANLWRKDFEVADTEQTQNDAIGEMEKLMREQRDVTFEYLESYVDDGICETRPFSVEELVNSWRAIRHLCDFIRVGSACLWVNGELYGLHDKVKILAEEG
jgi:hypothetical protein